MLGVSDISAFSVYSTVKLEDIVISREKYFCNGSSALFTNFANIGVGWIERLAIKREAKDTYQEFQCSVQASMLYIIEKG